MRRGVRPPTTVSEYIAGHPLAVRRHLRRMRAIIRKAAPGVVEGISYGITVFRLDGPLVYIGGFAHHVSFFPTGSGVRAFRKELARYPQAKGTVRFALDEPLPVSLIARIVRFRVRENRSRAAGGEGRRR